MDLFSKSPDIHNGVSGHVETVCLMSRVEGKSAIRLHNLFIAF